MKIVLLCSLGLSVETFKNQMVEEIKRRKLDMYVSVSAISDAFVHGVDADVILLTPQVKFNYHKVSQMFPDKLVEKISEENFANGNGQQVVAEVEQHFRKKGTACKTLGNS